MATWNTVHRIQLHSMCAWRCDIKVSINECSAVFIHSVSMVLLYLCTLLLPHISSYYICMWIHASSSIVKNGEHVSNASAQTHIVLDNGTCFPCTSFCTSVPLLLFDHLLQLREHDTYRTGTPSSLPDTSTGHTAKTSWRLQYRLLYICGTHHACKNVEHVIALLCHA